MEKYKFDYNDKSYELKEEECNYFLNDEEYPANGIEIADILRLLANHEAVDFGIEYYDQPCKNCKDGIAEKAKYFKFLEYHFYIFTKNNDYVISNISKEYENTSYNKLMKNKSVDNSYIVSVMVCVNCGDYSIEIEQCEI